MRLIFILFISISIIHHSYASDHDKQCRDLYYQVCLKEISLKDFSNYLNENESNNNEVIMGYKAVINFLWADHYFNPIKKWNSFKKGKYELEKLIDIYPENIELRFLRITIQDGLPAFLDYSSDRETDRYFISQHINDLNDPDLKKRVSDYLQNQSITKTK